MKIVGGRWSNWSGGVACKPRTDRDAPGRSRTRRRRAPGPKAPCACRARGHSFTPLNATDGTMIDLVGVHRASRASILAADGDHRARRRRCGSIGPLLHPLGFGLKNMGDIDRQTLGGVVGTGTHGTGPYARQFLRRGRRFSLGAGEWRGDPLLGAQENAEIFAAGRTSMGMLGVMTEIAMNVRRAYKLVRREFLHADRRALRASSTSWSTHNRHFEFFWFPYADRRGMQIAERDRRRMRRAPRSAEKMHARGERTEHRRLRLRRDQRGCCPMRPSC